MTGEDLIAALRLPDNCRLRQRVSKAMLVDEGGFNTADKRLINAGLRELWWEAALKPNVVGVAAHDDEEREYLEIVVLNAGLRDEAKPARLNRLLHRAVPYPVILILEHQGEVTLSLAHKRRSQNEREAFVLDGDLVEVTVSEASDSDQWPAFRDALALARQPRLSMLDLYQGWISTSEALHAARITGAFALTASPEQAAVRRSALVRCKELQAELARLRVQAGKEKQMQRQIDINNKIRRLKAEYSAARDQL